MRDRNWKKVLLNNDFKKRLWGKLLQSFFYNLVSDMIPPTGGKNMGYLYFVRPGQTNWNVENKICGATDIALTDCGHEQAIETGK